MGLFNHFPYTNFHELNLDWLLTKFKSLEDDVADVKSSFDALEEEVSTTIEAIENVIANPDVIFTEDSEGVITCNKNYLEIRAMDSNTCKGLYNSIVDIGYVPYAGEVGSSYVQFDFITGVSAVSGTWTIKLKSIQVNQLNIITATDSTKQI